MEIEIYGNVLATLATSSSCLPCGYVMSNVDRGYLNAINFH